ncbi:histidine--tRNA ligase [Mycoplasma sp. Mirounga ES2805-ORL]|uniref:histidine--tRNA ligase n=1 Tax=Mycoplasma sp. Mirounga ES2805-ORL TaxID=754514 RepID=UPI00197B5A82|nr:histidine--tRNA ligase [Mycoplasma sp. Mirounga ES2805-ORL]QSF13790.1 histidine--tRNA ligase [Mycoplasma sp. Mirounga ES2805-ORL]
MINKIKGTRDYQPSEFRLLDTIKKVFISQCNAYNVDLIETPIIEAAELYKRSVAGSDIVKKEMYEFEDKGKRAIALRPEGTAGFVRALVENKWYASKNNKFAYFGPMFRYEQPQKGRYRQFYQAGVEIIGDSNPYLDCELISLANNILKILDMKYILKINSIGDIESRKKYEDALREYLLDYKDELTTLSQERLDKNVLRILDDKIDGKKDFLKKAPKIKDYLSDESKKYFEEVTKLLDELNIKYQIDYSLVRGLDYYDQLVFEFVSTSQGSGSQSTLIGGGRYSSLIQELGGPKIGASGFGFGIDRCMDIIIEENGEDENYGVDILIASTQEENKIKLFSLANELRNYNIKVEFINDAIKSKKIFDKAEKLNASCVIFDDKFNEQNTFVCKILNDKKIVFAYTEDGFIDLMMFLEENGIIDESLIEEIEE